MREQQNGTPGDTASRRGWRSSRADDRYDTPRPRVPTDGAEAAAADAEPAADERVEPQVERRSGTDRRLEELQVAEERRVAERRVARQESIERRRYVVSRATHAVDYLFYLLYGLLAIRFALALLGASESAGFVSFIYGVTQPFYAPFSGIVSRPLVNGGVLDFPLLIALLAYALLHLAVRGLLRLTVGDRTTT